MKSRNQDSLDLMRNILGEEMFMQIASALAGERITFPRSCQWLNKEERNKSMMCDFYEGIDVPELARKYDLSESHVYKIVERRY